MNRDEMQELVGGDAEPNESTQEKTEPEAMAFIPNDGIEDIDFDAVESVPAEGELETEASPLGVLGALNFNQSGAETGVWFPWPKFGPKARLRIAFVGCQRYQELMKKARRKYGRVQRDGSWKIEDGDLRRVIPAVFAQALFTAFEEVPLGRCCDTPNYSLVREQNSLLLAVKGADKSFHFEAQADDHRPENYLADTEQNRHRLLLAFQPELEDDIWKVATKRSRFRDQEIVEALRGN